MTESSFLSVRNRLQDLRDLQSFCLGYEHAVQEVPTSGILYKGIGRRYNNRRASTFVYTFFVFNSLYSIDWQQSLASPSVDAIEASGHEQEQFWKMVDACYANTTFDASNLYSNHLRRYCKRLGIDDPLRKLRGIQSSPRIEASLTKQFTARHGKGDEISIQSIADFRESFKALWQHDKTKSINKAAHQKALNNVLYFIYLVRCNVFHGRKGIAVANIEPSQDKRLLVYSGALLATNQLVFDHAQQALTNKSPI